MYANANHLSDNELELENLMLCQSITECVIDGYNLTGTCICTECGHIFDNIHVHNNENMHYVVLRHIQDHYRLLGVRQPDAPAPIAPAPIGAAAGAPAPAQAQVAVQDDDDLPQLEPFRQPQRDFIEVRHPILQSPILQQLRNIMVMEYPMEQQIIDGFNMMAASINAMGGNMIIMHNFAGGGGDDDYDDNSAAREYRYRCHVCNRGYDNEMRLNTHFMRNHNNFDGLNILDKKASNGFPGFDVLQKIKMIRYVQAHEKMDDNICCICCNTYDKKMYNKTDDDIYLKDKITIYKNNIDDHKLLYLKKDSVMKRMPIQLKCCRAIFCTECLYNHIVSKYGEPECPFCMKNHNLVGKRFVIFDERPSEKIALNPDPYPIRCLDLE